MVDCQDLRIPAHRFRQGGRDVYACILDLPALNARLPDRLDDKIVKDANRQLTPSHARRIQTYLAERPNWVLSALMLGVPAEAVDFRPYSEDDGAPMQVGELHILAECVAEMKMFDGQHRRRAIKDVLRELELDIQRSSTALRPAGMLAANHVVYRRRYRCAPADVRRCRPDQDHRAQCRCTL